MNAGGIKEQAIAFGGLCQTEFARETESTGCVCVCVCINTGTHTHTYGERERDLF